MFYVNMVSHLWDVVDEGLESVLDLLQGQVGVTGLCTPVTSGPVRHIRFSRDVSPRIFQTRGGVFFQPDKGLYENTRCKPMLSEWLRTRNPFAKLSQLCRERELGLRAVIECANIGRIAAHDPHFARKNVFGDVSSQLCLANADVAEFIRALAVDVCANFSLDTVELAGLDVMPSDKDDPHHDLGLGARQLLALCFCESCRQSATAAGVDIEAAARSTAVRLDTVFRTGCPLDPPLITLVADDPPLSAFLAWYNGCVTELFSRIRSSCDCRVVSHARSIREEDEAATNCGQLRGADAVVCEYTGSETAALERLIERMRGTLDDRQGLEIKLPVHPPPNDEQALFRNLARVAELGIASANLDHYGRLPWDRVDLVKQAVRFARRSSR